MQGSDSYLRSSLEDQIEEARRRAYSYANSLKGVREQDAHRVKSFEEERDRWTRTFEEKSVLIEQLERELKSAVDALDLQRLQSQQRPMNSTLILDDDQINSEFKRLLHVQSSPNRSSSSPNRKQAAMDTTRMANTNRSFVSDVNYSSRFPAPPNFGDTLHSQTQLSFNAPVPPSHTTDVWNHLLEQYKEQLQRSREDITQLTREKKDLVQRLLDVTKELTLVADERDQMKKAMEDMEGKLQFRSAQVREYELERDRLLDVDGSKASTIERLQHEVNSLRFQLSSLERENKVSIQTIAALQQEIQQNSVDANRTRYLDEIRQKDEELYRLRQQLNDKDHLVRQELAETKQLVRSLQLRLSHAESLNQVSHLEQRYDRSTRRTGQETSSLSPRASSSGAGLVRSPSHERLHGTETISSSLKRANSRENLLASSEGTDATLLRRSSSRDVTNNGSGPALGRSPSREKLSKSPSRDQLLLSSSLPTRSPSRVGSGLSIDTGVPPSHQHQHQHHQGHGHAHGHGHGHDVPPARSLSKSPSKSKLSATATSGSQPDASPSPRRSNSSVNFRDVEDVHVFSPDAAAHHHGHHHTHAHGHPHVSRARSSSESEGTVSESSFVDGSDDNDDDESGDEDGVYEVESADDIFRSTDDYDDHGDHRHHHREASSQRGKKAASKKDTAKDATKKKTKTTSTSREDDVAAKKKSRNSRSPVTPAISVTISPKKKSTATVGTAAAAAASAGPAGATGHAAHHHHHHTAPVATARGGASHASPPVLKSALKGRVLHVPGGPSPSPSHPPLPPTHTTHVSHLSRSPVTPLSHAPVGKTTSTRSPSSGMAQAHHVSPGSASSSATRTARSQSREPSADRHVTSASKTKPSSTTSPSTAATAMAARKAAAGASSSSSPSTAAAATKKKATAAVVVMPDHHHRHHSQHQQQHQLPPSHTQHQHAPSHGHHHRPSSAHHPHHAHHHHHGDDDDDGSHSGVSLSSSSSTSTSSTSSSSSSMRKRTKKAAKKSIAAAGGAAKKKKTSSSSSTKKTKAKKLKRSPSAASIDERTGRHAERHRHHAEDPTAAVTAASGSRSRSASAHSRVSSVGTTGASSTVTSPIEHRPYMRPTSSFIGKIKDKDGNVIGGGGGDTAGPLSPSSEHRNGGSSSVAGASAVAHGHVAAVSPVSPRRGSPSPSPPKRTSSHRDVLRSSAGGESIGSGGGRDSDLSPTRRGVWVPAATAGATALLHPRLSRLSSASSAASFHLPTKSSLSKSAFVENMHLSR